MTLLEQLQAATEGSRELSDEVLLACGWYRNGGQMTTPDGYFSERYNRPDPSRNLQDAVSLLSRDWEWELEWQTNPDIAICKIGHPLLGMNYDAPTLALAVCQAAVKAHQCKAEAA